MYKKHVYKRYTESLTGSDHRNASFSGIKDRFNALSGKQQRATCYTGEKFQFWSRSGKNSTSVSG